MKYLASLRVGQNDVKALVNIEQHRRLDFTPLLNMRGNDDRHLVTFLSNWGNNKFLLDISRLSSDVAEEFIQDNDLHNPADGFSNKISFFQQVYATNQSLIPVISWTDSDPQRDVVQCALKLSAGFKTIALRVACTSSPSPTSWNRLKVILDAVPSPERVIVVLDFGTTPPTAIETGSPFHHSLLDLAGYQPMLICLLSSSFPSDKPPSNASRTVPCQDIMWQSLAQDLPLDVELVYGDYAATNPSAAMEYIKGMPILPFANYYMPVEWWQKRKGSDKEFFNYVELAKDIRSLSGYHGDDFCWATREFKRIATSGTSYGNNGTWNGYKINQHICAMLEQLKMKPTEFDIEDLI